MKLRAGEKLGTGWRLQRRIASGAIASVWLAEGEGGAECAVKVLNIKLQPDQDRAAERFDREARKARRMRSPFVPTVLEHGLAPTRQPFLALERLTGTPLSRVLELRGRFELADVGLLLDQLADAIDEAHASDMTHRELRADNVMLVAEQPLEVRLLGLGLAKELRIADETTRPNTAVGNILDKAPEELMGHAQVGAHTDLWALGALMYEALTGRRPFVGTDLVEVRDRIRRGAYTMPGELLEVGDVPMGLDAWFRKAMAYEPEQRFSRAGEMAERWREVCAPDAIPALSLSDDGETTLVMPSPQLAPSMPMLLTNERPEDDDDDDAQPTLIRASHLPARPMPPVPPPPPRRAFESYASGPARPPAPPPPRPPSASGAPEHLTRGGPPSTIPADVPSSDYVPAPTVSKAVAEAPAAAALRRRTRRAVMAALASIALAVGTYYALVGAATMSQPNAGVLEPVFGRVVIGMTNALRTHALRLDRGR